MLLLRTPAVAVWQSWWTPSSSWLTVGLRLHPGSQGARSNGCTPLHASKAFWWDTHAQRQRQAATSLTRPSSSQSNVGRASGVYQRARHSACTGQAQPASSGQSMREPGSLWQLEDFILSCQQRKLGRFSNAAEHEESQDKEKSKFQKSNIKIKFCHLQMPSSQWKALGIVATWSTTTCFHLAKIL